MRRHLIIGIALTAAAFHLFAAGISPFTALVQRPIHLALMATLGFLGVGVRNKGRCNRAETVVLIAAVLLGCLYIVGQQAALVGRVGAATKLDLAAGAVVIVLVLELARRTAGWGLVIVALTALAYAFSGPYLPGFLAHRGYGAQRLIEHLYLSTEGIWGIPLGVSANFVYLFVLFGAILEASGGGKLLIGLAGRISSRSLGGPAKTASVSSALMGSLSGSAVANVATTGALTIPMMKGTGFRPRMAAAIEAAASTGGQLMPPVMGAGAFILATWTNIPYLQVASAALIPAVLYYTGLYMAIHFGAAKENLETAQESTQPGALAQRLHLLVPIFVIVVFLALGRSPMRAAFWGAITAALVATARSATRMDRAEWRKTLIAGSAGTVQVAAACATAGIVVGVASLTGIGLRMSEMIITVAQGHLPVALLLTALGSIVLGMGLPTTAAYVVLAALGAPALTELGVPLLAAHLFIFYYGCLSNVTPPVALAAYAAAGLAGSSPLRTGATAMGLAVGGFLVPFAFIYDPSLLLSGTVFEILATTLGAAIGVTSLAAGIIGYIGRPVSTSGRAILIVTGIALLGPGWLSDGLGIAIFATALWFWRKPKGKLGSAQQIH